MIFTQFVETLQNKIIINRPPRDGRMAFVKSPDQISIGVATKRKPLPVISPGRKCQIKALGKKLTTNPL